MDETPVKQKHAQFEWEHGSASNEYDNSEEPVVSEDSPTDDEKRFVFVPKPDRNFVNQNGEDPFAE